MYMPRRTAEFREEAHNDVNGSIATRRPTRSLARNTPMSVKTLPGTNKRPSSSRLPTPMCLERDRANQMGANTSRRQAASSVERAVSHHTDKKWVAERAQALVDYLNAMHSVQPIQGVPNEFFQRSSCLRQMTMKQFVAIVNFFFHHIWPNRVTVSSANNATAENIISALAKIKYPHQINKSSIMTPTMQHSFGHIIVMLDFLMDLAPDPPSSETDEYEFPFMETAEQLSMASDSTMSTTQSSTIQKGAAVLLDEELNALIFAHGPDCFRLWDSREEEKEKEMMNKIRDTVIGKKCGNHINNSAALEDDIQSMVSKLQLVEQEMNEALDNKKLQQFEQLQQEQSQLRKAIKSNLEEAKECAETFRSILATCEERDRNMQILTDELQRLQQVVKQQKYTDRQLSELQVHFTDLHNVNEAHKRSWNDSNERILNQQVMLARSKKKLLDKVELFNTHVRNLTHEDQLAQQHHLELSLSLKPQGDELPERRHLLIRLADDLRKRSSNLQHQIQQLERQKHKYAQKTIELDTERSDLMSRSKAHEQQLAQLETIYRDKRLKIDQQREALIARNYELSSRIEELLLAKDKASNLLESKKKLNCDYLDAAESYQAANIKARNEFCNEYELELDEAEKLLNAINAKIPQTEALLNENKQVLQDTQLPSLANVRSSLLE